MVFDASRGGGEGRGGGGDGDTAGMNVYVYSIIVRKIHHRYHRLLCRTVRT